MLNLFNGVQMLYHAGVNCCCPLFIILLIVDCPPRYKAYLWAKCALSAVNPMLRSDARGARMSGVSPEIKCSAIDRY